MNKESAFTCPFQGIMSQLSACQLRDKASIVSTHCTKKGKYCLLCLLC